MARHRVWIGSLVAVACAGLATGYWAGRARAVGAPTANALTYAGTLTDAAGTPVTGSKLVQLAIFDAATDGTSVCSFGPAQVQVTAGSFQIRLSDTCTAAIHANPNLWLETFVESQSMGRTKLGAIPYALEADRASTAVGPLDTRIAAAEAAITALQTKTTSIASAYLRAVDSKFVARAALGGDTPAHWDACLASGNAINCGVIASRFCAGQGYATGFWNGECSDTQCSSRQVYCIK